MTALRIADGFRRGAAVTFQVDGAAVSGHRGETLAAALLAAGITRLRHSPREFSPRGAYCFMGVCQECVVQVDGVLRQSCQVPVEDGLVVELKGSL
jgi:predicted molibdopterin-dependent oxidoreductase YjgC